MKTAKITLASAECINDLREFYSITQQTDAKECYKYYETDEWYDPRSGAYICGILLGVMEVTVKYRFYISVKWLNWVLCKEFKFLIWLNKLYKKLENGGK